MNENKLKFERLYW